MQAPKRPQEWLLLWQAGWATESLLWSWRTGPGIAVPEGERASHGHLSWQFHPRTLQSLANLAVTWFSGPGVRTGPRTSRSEGPGLMPRPARFRGRRCPPEGPRQHPRGRALDGHLTGT